MMTEPNIPDGLRPLGLAQGYLISADGRVFNERTRREATPITLSKARRFATADIAFDPTRLKQCDGPAADELVCEEVVAVRFRPGSPERFAVTAKVTRWVRIIPPDGVCLDRGPDGEPAWRRDHADGRIEWIEDRPDIVRCEIVDGHFPAHGDTGKQWYFLALDATDQQCRDFVIMHGPSLAHKLFTDA